MSFDLLAPLLLSAEEGADVHPTRKSIISRCSSLVIHFKITAHLLHYLQVENGCIRMR